MSNGSLVWLFLLQFVFIILNAIFAASEIAVIKINQNKLEQLENEKSERIDRLKELIEDSSEFLATIQIGITLVNLLSSAVATENFSSRLISIFQSIGFNIPTSILSVFSLGIITLILTYFTVVVGELVPKQLALKNPEKIALFFSGLVYWLSKVFTPAVWLFSVSTNGILHLFGVSTESEEDESSEEEIRLLLGASARQGNILPEEENMIQNIFEFNDTIIEDIMTHRTEVDFLWMDDSIDEWEKTILEGKHSIYPVCEDTFDNILGVLYTKDYFSMNEKSKETFKNEAIRPVTFVLETMKADEAFKLLKQIKERFIVVIDEFGGTSGIITMNDLLEQIVGEFNEDDEVNTKNLAQIKRMKNNSWMVYGRTPLSKINSLTELDLPDDEFVNFNDFYTAIRSQTQKENKKKIEYDEYGFALKDINFEDGRLKSATLSLLD